MPADRNVVRKEVEKKLKYKSLCTEIQRMWNLKVYDHTNNNWSYWNSNEKLKEKFGSCTRKILDRFTTKDSYTWNIAHNTESTAVWNLKPERWGSPLVQEKYRGEKACDKSHPYRIIIIIIIIICGLKVVWFLGEASKGDSSGMQRDTWLIV